LEHAIRTWEVDIISISLGFDRGIYGIRQLLKEADQNDILVFAAVSNNGAAALRQISWPASMTKVFGINSANFDGESSSFNPSENDNDTFSRYKFLGEGVRSAWPLHLGEGEAKCLTGTSIATPIAAATAALFIEFMRQNADNNDEIAVDARIMETPDGMREMFYLIGDSKRKGDYLKYVKPWGLLHTTELRPVKADRNDILSRIRFAFRFLRVDKADEEDLTQESAGNGQGLLFAKRPGGLYSENRDLRTPRVQKPDSPRESCSADRLHQTHNAKLRLHATEKTTSPITEELQPSIFGSVASSSRRNAVEGRVSRWISHARRSGNLELQASYSPSDPETMPVALDADPQFAKLHALEPNWRSIWGHDLERLGITDDLIMDHQDFVVDFIKKRQANLDIPDTDDNSRTRPSSAPPEQPQRQIVLRPSNCEHNMRTMMAWEADRARKNITERLSKILEEAEGLLDSGRSKHALDVLESLGVVEELFSGHLKKSPTTRKFLFLLSTANLQLKLYTAFLSVCQTFLSEFPIPNDPEAIYLCGIANYHVGNIAEAIRLLDTAMRTAISNASILYDSALCLMRAKEIQVCIIPGDLAFQEKDWAKAIYEFGRALEVDPTNKAVHLILRQRRAGAFMHLKEYKQRTNEYRSIICFDPSELGHRLNKATAYHFLQTMHDDTRMVDVRTWLEKAESALEPVPGLFYDDLAKAPGLAKALALFEGSHVSREPVCTIM